MSHKKSTTISMHHKRILMQHMSQAQDQEVEFNPKPPSSKKVHHSRKRSAQITTQQQAYMPYIEGPAMDWTVNDGLYNRFIKWKIRCENILECEARKCKKVIAWSGDFGLDQYISWNLSNEELCLDTIWQKYEEFCKPQANELRARFDLLTSFKQDQMSVDEWYNKVQTQIWIMQLSTRNSSDSSKRHFLVLFEQ